MTDHTTLTEPAASTSWHEVDRLVLGERYNGPPDTANGGYACGRVAAYVDGPASVRLSSPPPLDTPLPVLRDGDGRVRVTHDGAIVAEARPLAGRLDVAVPAVPTYDDCLLARERHPARGVRHLLSDCFVCGPERHDGLGVTPGPLAGAPGLLAAPFAPPEREADAHGGLSAAYVWAALDCPSFPATALAAGRMAVLGQLEADVRRTVRVGERLSVVGWTLEENGRKYRTGSAVLAEDGSTVGVARATWIALR